MREPRTREILDRNMALLENRIDGIINYIENNPTCDPNAFEMNDVMFEMADIGGFGRKFEKEPYDFLHDEKYQKLIGKFDKVMSYQSKKFISDEQGLHADNL